jgi:PDZ domain
MLQKQSKLLASNAELKLSLKVSRSTQTAMVYRNLIHFGIGYLSFFCARLSVVGQQWEIGTWAPEDLSVNKSNAPFISPTDVVQEASLAYPSMEPSDSPSRSPSSTPTTSHAPSISSAPISLTSTPSLSPSLYPSIMPTPECHDHENYRSPLNSLNCSQHLGTDCFQWKHLGLTDVQVEDLINSCPTACGIACDTLFVFETNQTYRLLFVDNFLSPESTALFEEASANYLEKYVIEKHQNNRFSLNRVELLSQRVLEKVGPTRRLIRSLQASDSQLVDLELNVAFRGFVLYLNISEIERLIKEGIQTFGYMRALRFTNDPALQDVEVVLDSGLNPAALSPDNTLGSSKAKNSLSWIITVAILSGIGITVFVIAYLKLFRKTLPTPSNKEDFDSPIISPAASARSTGIIIPNFSYESIVRFAPTNIGQRSGTPTSIVESTGDDSSLKTSPNASMISRTESGEEEHPLTGIVPSMIVYDCIDGSDELVDVVESKAKRKNVVPSRQLAATVSFRKALQENSLEVLDKTMFTGIPDAFSHIAINDASHDQINKKSPIKGSLPKPLSKSEALSSSDSATVQARPNERDSMVESEFPHVKETLLQHIGGEIRIEPKGDAPNSSVRRYHFNRNHGRQIKIHAPRVGKLGLVLQSSDSHGHVVIQLKEYSPIRGQIRVGDRILCIDSQDTTNMTQKTVTKLISGSNYEVSGMLEPIEIIVWRRNFEMVPRDCINTPLKASGHRRSVSGSSMRSATSAPLMGSYRSQHNYQSYITTTHRPRNTATNTNRHGQNQYRITSQGSARSASSTPSIHRSHRRTLHTSKISPALSQERTCSRTSDTFISTHRRMLTPPLVPAPRSITKPQSIRDSNEC